MAKNDITGDEIKSRPSSKKYLENNFWKKVEEKKRKQKEVEKESK